MKNNRIFVNRKILFAVVLLVGIQSVFAQESRYINRTLGVAFQTPAGVVKDRESTDVRVIFNADENKFGLASNFEFIVDNTADSAAASEMLGTERGFEVFVKTATDTFKKDLSGADIKILEKKRVKIANLNAVKIVFAVKTSGIRMRLASYSVIVPEHERLYGFLVIALEDNFDRWLAAAETSVDSFEILKPASKSAHE